MKKHDSQSFPSITLEEWKELRARREAGARLSDAELAIVDQMAEVRLPPSVREGLEREAWRWDRAGEVLGFPLIDAGEHGFDLNDPAVGNVRASDVIRAGEAAGHSGAQALRVASSWHRVKPVGAPVVRRNTNRTPRRRRTTSRTVSSRGPPEEEDPSEPRSLTAADRLIFRRLLDQAARERASTCKCCPNCERWLDPSEFGRHGWCGTCRALYEHVRRHRLGHDRCLVGQSPALDRAGAAT